MNLEISNTTICGACLIETSRIASCNPAGSLDTKNVLKP